jgi:hypothetical protein
MRSSGVGKYQELTLLRPSSANNFILLQINAKALRADACEKHYKGPAREEGMINMIISCTSNCFADYNTLSGLIVRYA